MTVNTVLLANRGAFAVRVTRACQKLYGRSCYMWGITIECMVHDVRIRSIHGGGPRLWLKK